MDDPNFAKAMKQAQEIYANLCSSVIKVGRFFEKKTHGSFSCDLFVGQFDLALQIVLFDAIIADGSCGPKEIAAIRGIPKHNDLITSLRGLVGDEFKARVLGWDELEESDERTLQIFSELLETYADRMVENFVHYIAEYDYDETENETKMINRIEKGFMDIVLIVATANGSPSDVETRAASEKVATLLQGKYEEETALLSQGKKE